MTSRDPKGQGRDPDMFNISQVAQDSGLVSMDIYRKPYTVPLDKIHGYG